MRADTHKAFEGTDRFEVRKRIGRGGMGVVYEAFDHDKDALVALKTLRHVDADSLYRLKKEFRSLQDLQHPNLVGLGELIEADGDWFFTMELIVGVDFMSYVRGIAHGESPGLDTAKLTPRTAAAANVKWSEDAVVPSYDEERLRAAIRQLAVGLDYLHGAGKVHRDVKPSNMLVTPEGRLVLLDFGLVADTATPGTESSGHAFGTVAYMAPEQAVSGDAAPPADWYSFGVVLYEALTGRLPYAGSTPLDVLMKKQQFAPPPPRACVPGVPPDLDDLCADLLAVSPTSRPPGRVVLERVGAKVESFPGMATTSPSRTHAAPFVGRDQELHTLGTAFEDTLAGRPVTVLVEGESGVGKSVLIRQFVERKQDRNAVVLAGRCYERESVPYKAFDGVVDALSAFLRRLPDREARGLLPMNAALLPRVFPVLGRVESIALAPKPKRKIADPHELRRQVFGALRDIFGQIAELRPLILVIDDLQWADADSLLQLGDLMRPPNAPPLLLLISSRAITSDEASHVSGDVRRVPLGALPEAAALELAERLLRRAEMKTESAGAIVREAQGHPLYLDELVRHAATPGQRESKPLRLDEAIWLRASQLPEPARRILEVIAIAGAPMPRELAQEAVRMEAAEFGKNASLLRVASLVRTSGERGTDAIETFHDRVRDAVLAHLSDETRIALHQRLAVVLETGGAARERPELLMRHLEAADRSEEAAVCAMAAAKRAEDALAFDRQVELLKTAERLRELEGDEKRELSLMLGAALAKAGRGAEAADAYLEAADGADPVTRREAHTHAAQQLLVTGHLDRGLQTLAELLGEIGEQLPDTPRRALMSLLWQRLKVKLRGIRWTERHERQLSADDRTRFEVYRVVAEGLSLVDPLRGLDFQGRGLNLALTLGEHMRVTRSLAFEAVYIASVGRRGLPKAQRLVDRTRKLAERTADPFLIAWANAADGSMHYLGGSFKVAQERLAQAEAMLFQHPGAVTWELNNTRLFRLFALRHMGSYSQQRELFDRYVRDASRRGDLYAETSIRWANNMLWLVSDDVAAARRDLGAASWTPPSRGYHLQHVYELGARAEIALYEGDLDALQSYLPRTFRKLDAARSMLLRAQILRALVHWMFGRACVTLSASDIETPQHLREARRSARRLAREKVGYARAWGLLLSAAIELQADRHERAVDHLTDAITTAEDNHMLHIAAAARRRLGEILGGEDGAKHIAAADEWMTSEGVVAPEKFTEILAPGFRAPPDHRPRPV